MVVRDYPTRALPLPFLRSRHRGRARPSHRREAGTAGGETGKGFPRYWHTVCFERRSQAMTRDPAEREVTRRVIEASEGSVSARLVDPRTAIVPATSRRIKSIADPRVTFNPGTTAGSCRGNLPTRSPGAWWMRNRFVPVARAIRVRTIVQPVPSLLLSEIPGRLLTRITPESGDDALSGGARSLRAIGFRREISPKAVQLASEALVPASSRPGDDGR